MNDLRNQAPQLPPSRYPKVLKVAAPVTSPYYRAVFPATEELRQLSFGGEDRTGLIRHIAQCTKKYQVNIVGSFSARIQDRFAGSILVVQGTPEKLQELQSDLEAKQKEPVTGTQVIPSKQFDLTFSAPDRIGLLLDVSEVLTKYNINIAALGSENVDELPDDLAAVESLNDIPRRAFLAMRLDVPKEQLANLRQIQRELRQIGDGTKVKIQESVPKSRSPGFDVRRISAN